MAVSSMSAGRQIQGGGRMLAERGPAAIFYAELRNVTGLSEVLDPERMLQLASTFFSLAGAAVKAQDGEVVSLQRGILCTNALLPGIVRFLCAESLLQTV
jgi:class 3 adenylate cyclase